MIPVYPVDTLGQIEARWAAQHADTGRSLMVAAATSFIAAYPHYLSGQASVLVVAGPGNNGGDGYAIAQLLMMARVSVQLYAPLGYPAPERDAHAARSAFLSAGGVELRSWPPESPGVIVDALFGIGLNRMLEAPALAIVQAINRSGAIILAVDMPSGLAASNGQLLPESVQALATHCFIGYTPGLLTLWGPSCAGRLSLDRLGIAEQGTWRFHPELDGLPQRLGNTHKSEQGSVRVVGGRNNMAGAAILSAQAALNAGAGRVYLYCDREFFPAAVSRAPELMTLESLPRGANSAGCYILGPGLGRDPGAADICQAVIAQASTGVMDADALRFLAEHRSPVPGWVLTPHEGEAAALLGVDSSAIRADRAGAALAIAQAYQAVTVLKGAGTLVAYGERLIFCQPGSPAMATPGMGDCLAGIIGALLAQGLVAGQAAIQGVNWHAQLGSQLAREQRVVLASDIIARLKYLP